MAESKTTWGNRALAGFGALALATAGLLGGSTAAFADTPTFGNIDQAAKGSIIINKHKHQLGDEVAMNPDGTGSAKLNAGIKGVQFTAYKITDIDLNQSSAWNQLKALDPAGACNLPGHDLGSGIVSPLTDGDGKSTIGIPGASVGDANVGIGAYLVCETGAPAEVVDRALPFIVTIPLPYDNGWLYDVNVYPKNGTSGIEKSIENQEHLGMGSSVKFPVTTEVPALRKDVSMANYIITDTLDSRLAPRGIESISVDGVAVDKGFYSVVTDAQKVTVEFNADGLAWLKTMGEKKIVTTFKGKVTSIGEGAIDNKAVVYVNDPNKTNGLESNTVTTNWGDLGIRKVNKEAPSINLEGAKFSIYEAATPYGGTCEKAITGTPVSVNGEDVFTTKADGTVKIAGLFVSDSVNDAKSSLTRCYVLKEIEAPAGFITPQGDDALRAVKVTIGTSAVSTYELVENTQQGVPELPLTGANGQMLMIIGGSAVLLISAGLVMVNRRRASAQHNG